MLVHTLKRAKTLSESGFAVFATPALDVFLKNRYTLRDFQSNPALLDDFSNLDDSDLSACIKVWAQSTDPILSSLSHDLVQRHLFRIEIQRKPFDPEYITEIQNAVLQMPGMNPDLVSYYFYQGEIANNAYTPATDKINILHKDGTVSDISKDSDQLNISILSETITNYYLCYPKNLKI
jgi:hypothetical protein